MTEFAERNFVARRVLAAMLLLMFFALPGCAATLVEVLKQDPRDPDRYVRVSGAGGVAIFRDGQPLGVSVPQALRPGDVVQTGPESAAIIRLPEGHEIVLDQGTRVRLGSFIVEFGRLLARARGFFEVESANVIAGVEGTEFVFQVPRDDRSVAVTVLQGSVVCRSKTAAWAPLRLRPRERFLSSYPNTATPDKRFATDEEIREIRQWARKVEASQPANPPAPLMGYCCADGRVFPASRDRCPGQYSSQRRIAETFCRRQPEEGYCCSGGKVFPSTRERCPGSFDTDAGQARRDCQPRKSDDPPNVRPNPATRPY